MYTYVYHTTYNVYAYFIRSHAYLLNFNPTPNAVRPQRLTSTAAKRRLRGERGPEDKYHDLWTIY